MGRRITISELPKSLSLPEEDEQIWPLFNDRLGITHVVSTRDLVNAIRDKVSELGCVEVTECDNGNGDRVIRFSRIIHND